MSNFVSFSGGKDSSAMLLRMVELGYSIDKVVFADTTLEFPEIYAWIDKIENIIGMKIIKVKCKHTFDDWFYGRYTRGKHKGEIRGFPYVISHCWWARDSKIDILKKEYGKGNTINIGIALNESKRADAKMYKKGINTYNFPLIEWGWTEAKCSNYLKERGLEHPLSNRFNRTGCWLCPKQSKKSLKSLFKYYPKLWEKLKQYEKDSPHGFNPRFTLTNFEKEIKAEVVK